MPHLVVTHFSPTYKLVMIILIPVKGLAVACRVWVRGKCEVEGVGEGGEV